MTGGRERTVDEWAWLFLTAGWSLRRTYASRGLFSLMESWPIEADA